MPLWLQDIPFIFRKGTAVYAIYVTLLYDTVPIVVFYRIRTLQNKNKKSRLLRSGTTHRLATVCRLAIVGAGPIELLGYKSLLLRGWNLLSQRPKQVHWKEWWNFAGICQAQELSKEKKEKKKMHSFDLTKIYSL